MKDSDYIRKAVKDADGYEIITQDGMEYLINKNSYDYYMVGLAHVNKSFLLDGLLQSAIEGINIRHTKNKGEYLIRQDALGIRVFDGFEQKATYGSSKGYPQAKIYALSYVYENE